MNMKGRVCEHPNTMPIARTDYSDNTLRCKDCGLEFSRDREDILHTIDMNDLVTVILHDNYGNDLVGVSCNGEIHWLKTNAQIEIKRELVKVLAETRHMVFSGGGFRTKLKQEFSLVRDPSEYGKEWLEKTLDNYVRVYEESIEEYERKKAVNELMENGKFCSISEAIEYLRGWTGE